MNRRIFYITFLLLLVAGLLNAQENSAPKAEWNGYTQLRFTSNFNNVNSFAMRRMKLWVNSAPGFNEHWGFHVQTTITSNQNEKFLLQDVLAYYKIGQFKINMGQFIPQYSMQRFQPDFEIPLTERAAAINALIPDGTLGVRDIGVEANYSNANKTFETWIGVFNGNGIKKYRFDNSGIMLTNKTALHFFNHRFTAGYSFMYRKADRVRLLKVLPDSVAFSGDDVRFNLFARYNAENFHIQAEYLWASLNRQEADGYYVLAQYNLGKNQLVASWNMYNDLVNTTDDLPQVHLGYNYAVKGDKLKLMLDNGFNVGNEALKDYSMTLQLQLFFN